MTYGDGGYRSVPMKKSHDLPDQRRIRWGDLGHGGVRSQCHIRSQNAAAAVHLMCANDQRALDGLLWNRHLVERLRSEEGVGVPGASRQANA